jgi:hypothetical protein
MVRPTPTVAVIASSLIIWIGMNQIAPKPMQPASSATAPGTSSMRKDSRAASSGGTANLRRARSSSTVPSSSRRRRSRRGSG